jgi:hypothetical protein
VSSAPFDVQLVIERLRARVPALQHVDGASAYAAVKSLADFRTPCAYVLLANERPAGDMGRAGTQQTTATFGVVLAVRSYRDMRGEAAMDDASPLIGEIRQQIINWIPPVQGGKPCRWQQGDVLDYDATTLLWCDVFATEHFITGGTP